MLTSEYGAINMETGEYSLAQYAIKSFKYRCPCCDQQLKLRKGNHNRHHFAHYSQEVECKFYDVLSAHKYESIHEGYVHKTAKKTLKTMLQSGKKIKVLRRCATGQCSCYVNMELEELTADTVFVEEYTMTHDNHLIRPDLVRIEHGIVKEIYELFDTNQTREENRPTMQWYEFKANEILDTFNFETYSQQNQVILFCQRPIIKCQKCVQAEDAILKRVRDQDEVYNKHLNQLEKKLTYNPSNEFWLSLRNQLVKKRMLSDKQIQCLYRNNF